MATESKGIARDCRRLWGRTNEKDTRPKVRMTLTEEQLKSLLRRFDTNNDGFLSEQELKDAFHSLGLIFPGWRAWWALYHADANGDGRISEHEFQGLINYIIKHGYVKNTV